MRSPDPRQSLQPIIPARPPEAARPDRRPAWVERLDDRIRVAPEIPGSLRVERPVR